MKNTKKYYMFLWIAVIIIVVVLGLVYTKLKNVNSIGSNNESNILLAEINEKGLQKFIDDHNILKDDVLSDKVCPLIETGQEDWVKIATQMRYGKVVTHDAGFNESIDVCLGNALGKNPTTVFQTINNFPQIIYHHSRQDSSVILDSASTTAVNEIKRICNRTNYDFDDSKPSLIVYDKIFDELKNRKSSIMSITDNAIIDIKNACLESIDSSMRSINQFKK
jgi:hypothetical protein